MADPHVITALVRKRAELSGDIENTHKRLGQMIEALEKLDATLLLFDPDYQVQGIKPKAFRPPQDWSKRGEMTRVILNVLRQASEPLTTREIAYQVMAERAIDTDNPPLLKLMAKRVGVALRGKRDQGVVRSLLRLERDLRLRDSVSHRPFQRERMSLVSWKVRRKIDRYP